MPQNTTGHTEVGARLTPIRLEILRAISACEGCGVSAPTVRQIAATCGKPPSADDLFRGRLRGMALCDPPLVLWTRTDRWGCRKYPLSSTGRTALSKAEAR